MDLEKLFAYKKHLFINQKIGQTQKIYYKYDTCI